jgi:pseudouridine-5'-monophosphatase
MWPGAEMRSEDMRVIWCPHPMLKKEYAGREAELLAGRTGEGGDVDLHQLGEIDDGWAAYIPTLVDFPYEKYGIVVPPVEVENDPGMVEGDSCTGSCFIRFRIAVLFVGCEVLV